MIWNLARVVCTENVCLSRPLKLSFAAPPHTNVTSAIRLQFPLHTIEQLRSTVHLFMQKDGAKRFEGISAFQLGFYLYYRINYNSNIISCPTTFVDNIQPVSRIKRIIGASCVSRKSRVFQSCAVVRPLRALVCASRPTRYDAYLWFTAFFRPLWTKAPSRDC